VEAVINDYVSGELVQDQFSVVMDDVDVVREHFASVDAICAYLRSRGVAGQAGARG
jgi:hypothetical protein